MGTKITIADVAAAAGVSKATVSYVLNGRRTSLRLSDSTVSRVLEVCERLGYRADEAAVALSQRKSEVINMAFLSPWLYVQQSDFMSQIYAAFDEFRTDYNFSLTFLPYEAGELKRVLRPAKLKKFDVICIAGTHFDDDAYAASHAGDFEGRIIMINRRVSADGIYSVCGNDYEAEKELAMQIVRSGYYDRYIIINEGNGSLCRSQRLAALREVLGGGDEELDYSYFDADIPLLEAYERHRRHRPCFMFIMHNSSARFLVSMSRRGIAIPESCGIAGYDIHPLLADFLPVPLTTVDPQVHEMVRHACEYARAVKSGSAASCGADVVDARIVRGGSVRLA